VSTFNQLLSAVQDPAATDIVLAPGRYNVASTLPISDRGRTLTIRSLRPLAAELDANHTCHILHIQNSNVQLDGLWLRRGRALLGGCLSVSGPSALSTVLTIERSRFSECVADDTGGGNIDGFGGAIHSGGSGVTINIMHSTITACVAYRGGGIFLYADSNVLNMADSIMDGNNAVTMGGALCPRRVSSVSIVRSTFTRNMATWVRRRLEFTLFRAYALFLPCALPSPLTCSAVAE
jgi:hypothetical protein